MGLLSIFKRAESTPLGASSGEPGDAVQRARTRARQRLIGAVVLVIVGIIGFPLVFETQPRPIPVDIPIEVPRKDSAPALVMPPARTAPTAPTASAVSAAPPAAAPNDVTTESREEAGREVTAASSASEVAAAVTAAANAQARPDSKPPDVAATTTPLKSDGKLDAKPAAAGADGERARALLEGKPAVANTAEPGRFIVQVGAFADAAAAHETRVKVEKLGMKTYTQVATTSAGNRIRVRVGPFGSRADADKAMAKAKGAGLSAVVLTL